MSDMFRQYPFTFARSDEPGDGLTLEGYAAVFDSPATISERGRQFTETVARGAFKKTLSERSPMLMFNHGQHPLIGDMPLGVITRAAEDSHGLYVRARLSDNWLIQPVRDAIADGAVTGMSFRFEAIRDKWSPDRTARTLQELKVPELGPVGMPAYTKTTVGVRSVEMFHELEEDPDLRRDLAYLAIRDAEDPAPVEDAAPQGTSSVEPPSPEEPARATPGTHKIDRLRTVAKMKGLIHESA